MIDLKVLKELNPFEGMNEDQLKKLQTNCEEIDFSRGDKLFTQNDDALHLWIVREGNVDLRFELPDRRPTSSDMTVDGVKVGEKAPEAKVLGWSKLTAGKGLFCWKPEIASRGCRRVGD